MKNLILLFLAILIFNITEAQVKIEIINYKGWENSIELSNNEIKLVVVPQIGRIIHFSYLNEENLLFENAELKGKVFSAENPYKVEGGLAHAGFGGDRIWPTVQDDFEKLNGSRGLSDPWIDGSEWEYELVGNGVKISSRVSAYIGAKVMRTITLNTKGTTVNIQQKMKKIKLGKQKQLEPIPLTLWNLSKIKNPDFGLLPLQKNSIFKNGIEFQKWPDNTNSAPNNYTKFGKVGQLIPVPDLFQKMGADSKGWVAGVKNDIVFAQFFHFDKNETYPDGGTSATIFTCSDFTELECLSPVKKPAPGESLQFDIQWKLHKIKNTTNPKKKRKRAVSWLESELENR